MGERLTNIHKRLANVPHKDGSALREKEHHNNIVLFRLSKFLCLYIASLF